MTPNANAEGEPLGVTIKVVNRNTEALGRLRNLKEGIPLLGGPTLTHLRHTRIKRAANVLCSAAHCAMRAGMTPAETSITLSGFSINSDKLGVTSAFPCS